MIHCRKIWDLRLLLVGLFASSAAAQSVIYSNISNSVNGFNSVMTSSTWGADQFKTDSSNLFITGVTLTMNALSGTANGVVLKIFSDSANTPGSSVGGYVFDSPAIGGNHSGPVAVTFTPTSAIALTANTNYWLVVFDPNANSEWRYTSSNTGTSTGVGGYFVRDASSINSGGSWSAFTNSPYLAEISASAVPEPSTYAAWAGALALGATIILRRRNAQGTHSGASGLHGPTCVQTGPMRKRKSLEPDRGDGS
jgi:hypothetical protein